MSEIVNRLCDPKARAKLSQINVRSDKSSNDLLGIPFSRWRLYMDKRQSDSERLGYPAILSATSNPLAVTRNTSRL